MRRVAAKLGFVHRTLWQREPAYRWAVLLGPPPLLGGAVAALALAFLPQLTSPAPTRSGDAPWAHWNRPVAQDGQPFAEPPTTALPRTDASGRFVGLQSGWAGSIQPMLVDATQDVTVVASVLGSFKLDQPTIPLARVVDAGPPTGLFVGTAKTFFVVKTAGVYGLSARLARAGTQSANCNVRLGLGHRSILRNVVLNAAGDAVLAFPATEFQLEPGLYLLEVAVGCWRGDHVVGDAEFSLMVRHPAETVLQPAVADEVIRAFQRAANPAATAAAPTAR